MAYSSRGAGGRSTSRTGGRSNYSAPRGGGGNSAVPAVIAGVVILVVVVLAVVVLGKKDKPAPKPPPPPPTEQPAPVVVKKGPELGPRPNLPSDIIARAKAMMPRIRTASQQGTKLGDEAVKAKQAGDQDAWQTKLEEARMILKSGRDEWRAIEDEVAEFLDNNPSKGWDQDMLMDSFLKSESGEVGRLIDEPLSGMAKSGRGH